jgi:hypothetical protein
MCSYLVWAQISVSVNYQLRRLKMKTEKEFIQEYKRLGLWSDPCVAINDAEPFKGQEVYWNMAIFALQNAAAMRIVEAGLNPKDFGLEY